MSVWTIRACFEADSRKPSKQAHKCVSKKIENISRRFADCFAINFEPKWSGLCKSTLQAMSFEQFWQHLLTTSYHASTFARNCFCAPEPRGVRENRPSMKASFPQRLFARPLLGEEIPAICRPREQIEKSHSSLSAQTSIYWMKISWDLISNVHASKSIFAMSFFCAIFTDFKRKLPHDLDSDLFRSLIRAIHMKTHKNGADE